MLHLITGTNGAGKTLFALKWVMERAKKEGRPVAHNGRFKAIPDGPLADWKQIEFKDWQAEPDGTIFLIDEAHNDLPTRGTGTPPEHVKMLAEHRRRGFDFYLITQHPANIDSFVRRLIGNPGWHRHLKRIWGRERVSVLEWDVVNLNCEKPDSSRASGSSSIVGYPKEVYGWYESATIHTGKSKIPKMVWVGVGAIVVATVGTILSMSRVAAIGNTADTKVPAQQVKSGSSSPFSDGGNTPRPLTTAEYIEHRKPRLGDFPHTAPAYDKITEPVTAPYPAACVYMPSKGCQCWTQQATLMFTSDDVCMQVVKRGYFVDWQQPMHQSAQPARVALSEPSKQTSAPRTVPVPAEMQAPPPQLVNQGLVATNAQARAEAGGYGPRMSESLSVLGR